MPSAVQRSSGQCRSDPSPWLLRVPRPPRAGQTGLRQNQTKATKQRENTFLTMQSPAKFCPHYVTVSLLLLSVATIHMRGKQCKKTRTRSEKTYEAKYKSKEGKRKVRRR